MMSDPMAEIRASFFIECEELLEALQDGLAAMDGGENDVETINVCFRAVHSIKGGAGAFGLENLVRFAHRYETVMDEVRAGRLSPDREAMLLFFRAADVLSDIVRASRDGAALDAAMVESTLTELEALAGSDAAEAEADEEAAAADFQPMSLSFDFDLGADSPEEGDNEAETGEPRYEIRFVPQPELFSSGNEPLHMLRALAALGDAEIACLAEALPPLGDLDPEGAHIGWQISLRTDRPQEDIADVFDFVEGLCTLEIERKGVAPLPPLDLPDLSDLPNASPEEDDAMPIAPGAAIAGSSEGEGLPAGGSGPGGSRLTLREPGAAEPAAPKPAPPATAAVDPAPAPAARPAEKPAEKPAVNTTVRVDLERIDRLVNLVGELVINQAMLTQSVAEAGIPSNSPVAQGLEEFMQLTRDIQDSVMMIRAQPVKSLFQRMSRIVRESSAAVNKRVRLVTEGENTEVDKTVIERLADPLTHMIRNAVDHGLESGENRLAAGKTEEGTVTLTAAHRSGRVVIEVADDGGGIDRERVKAKAEEKGLIAEGLNLSDSEIDNLLFLPGFSTAAQISDLSGRGVGMDVVRSSIQALGGRITITSAPGKGSTFSISLPLTLAVLDGMVVKAAGETLVVPLGAIVETLSLQDNEIRTLGPETHVLHIRDTFVPLLDLGAELGYRSPPDSYDGSVVLLITQEDGARAALIVDRIEEQRQVVIKGLQDSYGRVPGIAAATILGDGQIALILDPVDLMANATGRTRSAAASLQLAG